MKLETFFEKFDQFADAPDAVAKMRELILDFAIGGQLLRTSKSAELEANGGWPKQTLGSIASLITKGSTPTSYGHQYEACGIPFVKVENIADGVINRSSMEQFISEATHEFLKRSQLESGDILFSIAGTIGKTCVVSSGDVPANTNQALAIIRGFSASFEIPFLKMQLDSFVANKVKAKARGGAMPNVSLGDLRDLLVVVPPLAEQKRIVAKVDELMALCDQLEAQQQERETRHAALAHASLARFADAPTPANLQFLFHPSYAISPADLRKSILTLAVQGKLVPQDPNDEPAENALRNCGVHTKRWAVGEDERRQAVPSSWTWIRFAGVGEQRLGKMLDAQKNRGESKPYLRNTNVQWMRFELDDVKEMPVEEREEEELRLKHGDLLICEGGEPGRCAIWRDEVPEMYFQKALHRVRPCDEILAEFLALNLQIDCRNDVLAGYFTGATIKHLTGRSLSEYPIPIPPLAEQRRIVAKVEQLMALVDALELQLATSRAMAENLLAAVVAELTEGTHASPAC